MQNLSNRSINMLKNDNVKWYQWYVLGNRDEVMEFQTYFCVGKYVHECIEWYHKTGEWKPQRSIDAMKQELLREEQDEDTIDKCISEFMFAVDNAKLVVTEITDKPEQQYLVDINEDYRLKIKLDAEYEDHIIDYKIVSSFKSEEDKSEHYQQASLYQYGVYKATGKKKVCKMVEILKKKQAQKQKIKIDLIALLPEDKQEEYRTKKVTEIRNALYLLTTKEDISNEIVFEWNDEIIDYVEDLLMKAMKKADRLQSLELDEVL